SATASKRTSPRCPTALPPSGSGAVAGWRAALAIGSITCARPRGSRGASSSSSTSLRAPGRSEAGPTAAPGPRGGGSHAGGAGAWASLGWPHLLVLHVEGAPRAALYGLCHGDRFAFYQSGHEPAWRPRSVGTVLLGHVLRHCHAAGLREFDFLRGSEPYKFR